MHDTGKKWHVQKSVNEFISNLISKSNTIKKAKEQKCKQKCWKLQGGEKLKTTARAGDWLF